MVNSKTAKCRDPVAAEQAHFHHRADSRYEVFILICCSWLSTNMALCIMAKRPRFGLIRSKGRCFRRLVVCSDANVQT